MQRGRATRKPNRLSAARLRVALRGLLSNQFLEDLRGLFDLEPVLNVDLLKPDLPLIKSSETPFSGDYAST